MDYLFWYEWLEKEFQLNLSLGDKLLIRKVIDSAGDNEEDIKLTLIEYLFPNYADNPRVYQILKDKKDEEMKIKQEVTKRRVYL